MEITPYSIIITTCPDQEEAQRLANGLIEKKLAACVQLAEIRSFYMWEGQINNEPEIRIMIKTKSWLYPHVEEFIIKNHSYSVPEIISVPIDKGSSGYLGWIDQVTE